MKKSVLVVASMALAVLVTTAVVWSQGEARAAVADTTRPTVTSTIPAPGAACVDPTANVSAHFSEDMKAKSIDNTTVTLLRADSTTRVTASVWYGATQDSAVINPTDPLEGNVTYEAVVTTHVKDLAGNRLDQDSARTGLQDKVWTFTTSADSVTPLECEQAAAEAAAQIDLRNAATAASACAADNGGSYVNCATVSQLQSYGFNPTVGVMVNGMNGNVDYWSAAMQHEGGGSAYTYATFGDNAGQVNQAPRGTSAPPLPDRTAEWEAMAQSDLRNLVTAANVYGADQPDGSYTGITVAALEIGYGFVPSPGVITQINASAGGDQFVAWSEHTDGGSAYQYDSATGRIVPISRF